MVYITYLVEGETDKKRMDRQIVMQLYRDNEGRQIRLRRMGFVGMEKTPDTNGRTYSFRTDMFCGDGQIPDTNGRKVETGRTYFLGTDKYLTRTDGKLLRNGTDRRTDRLNP
jgi:hypothetical protein